MRFDESKSKNVGIWILLIAAAVNLTLGIVSFNKDIRSEHDRQALHAELESERRKSELSRRMLDARARIQTVNICSNWKNLSETDKRTVLENWTEAEYVTEPGCELK